MTDKSAVIIDIEQARDVLSNVGLDAFAVWFAMESGQLEDELTIDNIAAYCDMSREQTRDACYRLALHQMGVAD